jgi:hypothetical protein
LHYKYQKEDAKLKNKTIVPMEPRAIAAMAKPRPVWLESLFNWLRATIPKMIPRGEQQIIDKTNEVIANELVFARAGGIGIAG